MTTRTPLTAEAVLEKLPAEARGWVHGTTSHADQFGMDCDREHAHALLSALKESLPRLICADITAIDYLDKDTPERFCVVYVMQERVNYTYFRVHAWVPEHDARIRSVVDLFGLGHWGERECHDMFGIVFDGNPDLRRHLMPEDYPGFPLLKDYPLKGHGERAQFTKVVPEGAQMGEDRATEYPITIGRGMHTPEYYEAIRDASRPEEERNAEKAEEAGEEKS